MTARLDPSTDAPIMQAVPEDHPLDPEVLEAGRWLFAQSCEFVRGVASLGGLPAPDRPEVAFSGRSNVGKSSLLNSLTGRTNLARTSQTPGRTQQINYFELGPSGRPALYLVDLPGYGYARAPREQVRAWTELTNNYLKGRPTLRRVFLLIDARHGLKAPDLQVAGMLDAAAVSYQAVLTKADKLKRGEIEERMEQTRNRLLKQVAAHPEVLATSSEKGTGIAELRSAIAQLVDLQAIGYKPPMQG